MNFLELAQAVRRECGIQGSGPSAVTSQSGLMARVVKWVSDADLYIQTLHPDWEFLWKEFTASTTAGSSEITKPDDFGTWDIEAFGINRGTTNGRSLTVTSYQEWRSNYNLKTNTEPYSLCILPNNNLELSMPADASDTLYGCYWKTPTVLSGNTAEPLYPSRFHRAIVAKAKMWFFEDIESNDQWQQAEKEFNEWLIKLESFALPNQVQGSLSSPQQMVVIPR